MKKENGKEKIIKRKLSSFNILSIFFQYSFNEFLHLLFIESEIDSTNGCYYEENPKNIGTRK